MGGQGGGVLSGWLLQLAEGQGWRVQTTSVPGVAQRTGATIYYLEMLADARADAVLALMPSPAAVDIIIAAELMEAGRAIQRGLVSPQRTTMIASDHRAYAVLEKVVPGDGSGDESVVLDAARNMSKTLRARKYGGDFESAWHHDFGGPVWRGGRGWSVAVCA